MWTPRKSDAIQNGGGLAWDMQFVMFQLQHVVSRISAARSTSSCVFYIAVDSNFEAGVLPLFCNICDIYYVVSFHSGHQYHD